MNSLPAVPSASSRDGNAPSETAELSFEDQAALARAMRELERTNLAIRLSAIIGRQVSAIGSIMPANISEIANKAAETAIRSGLNFSFRSLAGKPLQDRRRMHKSLAVLAGAAGGAFGFSSLPVELAKSVTEAASYLSGRGVVNEFAPALVRLVAQIGNYFGVVVSQKLVAQSVPLIGAAGGAAINYAFADHFQTIACGHFTILRLERQYGVGVPAAFERVDDPAQHPAVVHPLLKPFDLTLRLVTMGQKGLFQLVGLCRLRHFREIFQDLSFGEINVFQRVIEKISQLFFGHFKIPHYWER